MISTAKAHGEWIVQAVTPRDHFGFVTTSVDEWLNKYSNNEPWHSEIEKAREDFKRAEDAVTKHPAWEGELREPPRVAYDPVDDSYYFIFKLNNNGTTFIVSKREMPEMKK